MATARERHRPFFLRCYSKYLAGERSKGERTAEVAGPLGQTADVVNEALPAR